MARRHGRRPHRVSGVCHKKRSAWTTWDAAMAAVAKTPGAVRAYLGGCCGYYHITRYTEDEYAQRVAEFGVQTEADCDTVDSNDELSEDIMLTNKQRKDAGLNVANPERVTADQERRRSSAATPQERGNRRRKTRRDARNAAIREEM